MPAQNADPPPPSSDLPSSDPPSSDPFWSDLRATPPEPDAAGLPPLTLAARGLGMLFAEGVSVGFGVWTFRAGTRLIQYAAANDLGPRGRVFVLGDMFGTGLAACLVALLYLIVRRRAFAAAARRVSDVGWRLAPLVMVGFLPLLLKWQVWVGRDLNLLMLAAIFGLGVQALSRPAFRAPRSASSGAGRIARVRPCEVSWRAIPASSRACRWRWCWRGRPDMRRSLVGSPS